MSSPVSIDDLPPEMICELFYHLQPMDLVACSMVNKRWYSIYSGLKLTSLVVDIAFGFNKWHHSGQRIQDRELCYSRTLVGLADKPLLSNLKHLALCGHRIQFEPDKLFNCFRQTLVHLEIDMSSIALQLSLNLPKLKLLAFHQHNVDCALSIDSPELSVLAYRGEPESKHLLDVKHPETIRKLNTDMLGQKLIRFKNVECLLTTRFAAISKATLQSLPKLKELHYNESINHHLGEFRFIGTVDEMKQKLREFMGDVKFHSASGFKFKFAGFQLTKTKLDAVDFGAPERRVPDEYIYAKNYHLIDPDGILQFILEVDYHLLIRNARGRIPISFFEKKFAHVEIVHAIGAGQDEKHLLRFLRSLIFLKTLGLEASQFSQEFYDQLPESAGRLIYLELYGGEENVLKFNFDFVGRLPCLCDLIVWPSLSFELLTSLVSWLGRLVGRCYFPIQLEKTEKRFKIEKDRGSKVWEVYGNFGRKEFENPNRIVNFFEELQRDTEKTNEASD